MKLHTFTLYGVTYKWVAADTESELQTIADGLRGAGFTIMEFERFSAGWYLLAEYIPDGQHVLAQS